jgi:hypothetical protein
MTERKNTPLPWSKHDYIGDGKTMTHIVGARGDEWDSVRIAIGSDATLIGSVEADINQTKPCGYPTPKTAEEVEANADLLLRAVNSFDALLDACKAVVHNAYSEKPSSDWSDKMQQALDLARAAIAKAEAPVR